MAKKYNFNTAQVLTESSYKCDLDGSPQELQGMKITAIPQDPRGSLHHDKAIIVVFQAKSPCPQIYRRDRKRQENKFTYQELRLIGKLLGLLEEYKNTSEITLVPFKENQYGN